MKNPYTSALSQHIQPRLARPLAVLALLAATTAQGQTLASFAAVSTYPAGGAAPNGVAVADVNGDGRPDIITANYNSSTAGVLLGQAGGGFAAVTTFSTGANSTPLAVVVADINGDSRPDIIAANRGTGTAGVLLGQASGGFAAVSTYPAGGNRPEGVAVADVNGDGRPDIITANTGIGTAGVLLGQASGGFAAVSTYPTGGNPLGVAVADVNGDGRPDIVTVNATANAGTAGVLLGLAGGGFAAVTTYSTGANSSSLALAVADMNGDGRPDIITANPGSSTAGVLLGGAGGGFAAVSTYPAGTGNNPLGVAVADVNGDGRPDVIMANGSSSNTVGVLLGQASGGFTSVSTYPTGIGPYGVAVADVNGDGRPDIVTANFGSNSAGVLLNTGTFTPLAATAGAVAADVALFPNPARGGFALRLPAAWGAARARAELLNALGQVVAARTVVLPAGAALNFATDGLAPGVYVLRVQASGHTLARRVVLD